MRELQGGGVSFQQKVGCSSRWTFNSFYRVGASRLVAISLAKLTLDLGNEDGLEWHSYGIALKPYQCNFTQQLQ